MLIINTKSRELHWHVGEQLPQLHLGPQSLDSAGDGRIIRFQADGHEFEFIWNALQRYNQQTLDRYPYPSKHFEGDDE